MIIREIEKQVLDKFYFITNEWKFSQPLIKRDRWGTTISYLGEKIALELEIDWRDIGFTVLITKIVDGKLPKGYYVNNGRVVRISVFKIFEGEAQPEVIKEIKDIVKNNNKKDAKYLCLLIDKYKYLTYSYGKKIIGFGSTWNLTY